MEVKDLPNECFHCIEHSNEIVKIVKGEGGYFNLGSSIFIDCPLLENETHAEWVRRVNDALGVDKETEMDMVMCSMFKWK